MTTSPLPIFLSNICQLTVIPSVESISAKIWFIIQFLWPWYWFLIILLITIWTIFEIITRHGNAHFNSDNGFSPLFNSFVGSGTYILLQYLTYLVLESVSGPGVYCRPWSYIIHFVVFLLTGGLLFILGFWVYWRLPNGRKIR